MAKALTVEQVARQQAATQLKALQVNTRANRIAANAAAQQARYIRNHPNAPGGRNNPLPNNVNITPGTDSNQGGIAATGTPNTSDAYAGGGAIGGDGLGGTPTPANDNTVSGSGTDSTSALAASATSTNTYLLIGVAALGGLWLYLHYHHG